MEERIIELEKKLSFLEHSIEELNDVVLGQHKTIEGLELHVSNLKEQLNNERIVKDVKEEERPPHY